MSVKGNCSLSEHVAEEIHLLWVILWSNLQSQTHGRAPGSRQGYSSWKVSVRSYLSSDALDSCPITKERTSAYYQWPLVVDTTMTEPVYAQDCKA